MTEFDPQVLDGVLALLGELKEDWEYEETIDPQTRFIADLGLESLEIVVLATMIQQKYGKMPFPVSGRDESDNCRGATQAAASLSKTVRFRCGSVRTCFCLLAC